MPEEVVQQPASPKPLLPVLTDRERQRFARSFDIRGLRLTRDGKRLVIDGEVACYQMKKLAGSAASHLLGFLHVVNRLRVVPQSYRRDSELEEAAQAALDSRAALVNEKITVSVRDGIVRLRGSVSSPAVRCEAEAAAWAVGGVVDVENRLGLEPLAAGNGHAGGQAPFRPPTAHPAGEDARHELRE